MGPSNNNATEVRAHFVGRPSPLNALFDIPESVPALSPAKRNGSGDRMCLADLSPRAIRE